MSEMLGISWRGWLAFIVILTYCVACGVTAWVEKSVPDHMVQIVSIVVGFYFGQKIQKAGGQ